MLKTLLFISLVVLVAASYAFAAKIKAEDNGSTKLASGMDMDAEDQEKRDDQETNEDTSEDQDMTFNLEEVMNECNESFRIEMGYLSALNSSGSFPDETIKTPKCYIRCVLERLNVASPEGKFDANRTAGILVIMRDGKPSDLNRYEKMAEGCIDRQESCKCEKSYQFLKCIFANDITKSK